MNQSRIILFIIFIVHLTTVFADDVYRVQETRRIFIDSPAVCRAKGNTFCPPRRKWISASTRELKYASYVKAWRLQMEQTAKFNYFKNVDRNNLHGSVIVNVAINPDGTLNKATIRNRSENMKLDKAVVDIVNLAPPLAPFPDSFKNEVDILHVVSKWQIIGD